MGPLGPELFDVVALAGIAPTSKQLQILLVIYIIPPGPDVTDPDIGIAGQQTGRLALRHHRDHRYRPLFQAVRLNGLQGGVLVSLRTGDRVVEDPSALMGVPDDQAPGDFRPRRMQHRPPHQLRAHGVLAKAVLTVLVIFPQLPAVLFRHRLKFKHIIILFVISLYFL